MLIGQREGKISEKHQIAFPRDFREVLGSRLIITRGLDKCLIIVSEKNWETLLEGTAGKPFINKNSRIVQRYILGNAAFVELDTKGRFILPDFLRKYAQIYEDVIFAGIQRYVEMWDAKLWFEQQESLVENIITISQKLNTASEREANE